MFGYQVPMADLFGHGGRLMLRELEIPQPWRGHVDASLELIDELELRIAASLPDACVSGRRTAARGSGARGSVSSGHGSG